MIRVLVIDDTKSVHAFVKSILMKVQNVEVTSAHNGAEGVEVLKKDKSFDIIFLDWEMPVLDGPSTFATFLQMQIQIPTLMMTTKNKPEDIMKMLDMGVSDYLMKPFTPDILLGKIESLTGKDVSHVA